ncbi:MAG: carbohydrate kinase [Geodermatophilaceae bacterium]|nr:carbohydrate kinase [Geodermatophilaceae bacterium]
MLVVCGEALVDLISDGSPAGYQARPGGSPLNVAVGTARLGLQTSLLARFATGGFGPLLRGHAVASGINLSLSVTASDPATIAVVSLDPAGTASYEFYVEGTTESGWQESELPDRLPPADRGLHIGSIASWREPAAALIADLAVREHNRGVALISFDPNLRPALVEDRSRARVEDLVEVAHLVKVSVEDLRWLYPGEDPDVTALRWSTLGPGLVVLTDGADRVRAYRPRRVVRALPATTISVLDTVGAGDAFSAGLLAALAERGRLCAHGLDGLEDVELDAMLTSAGLVAAITCTRAGADPPNRAERDAFAASLRR